MTKIITKMATDPSNQTSTDLYFEYTFNFGTEDRPVKVTFCLKDDSVLMRALESLEPECVPNYKKTCIPVINGKPDDISNMISGFLYMTSGTDSPAYRSMTALIKAITTPTKEEVVQRINSSHGIVARATLEELANGSPELRTKIYALLEPFEDDE